MEGFYRREKKKKRERRQKDSIKKIYIKKNKSLIKVQGTDSKMR